MLRSMQPPSARRKVYNIVRSMSLNPAVLRQSMALYKAIMLGPSGLTRRRARAPGHRCLRRERVIYLTALAADDLRDEGADEELARHAEHDYRGAKLDARTRALCDYARKLTLMPSEVGAEDADASAPTASTTPDIHDAIQVVAGVLQLHQPDRGGRGNGSGAGVEAAVVSAGQGHASAA